MNPFWESFMLVYVNWFHAVTLQICPGSSTCENGIKSSNMAFFFQILIMVLKHNIMREILSMLSCLLILLYKYRAIQAWKTKILSKKLSKSSSKSSPKALQKALQKSKNWCKSYLEVPVSHDWHQASNHPLEVLKSLTRPKSNPSHA